MRRPLGRRAFTLPLCRTSTPCALLREDGSAKHASNASGDPITRFRDSMLYGDARCGGGSARAAAGVGAVPKDEAEGAKALAALRVSRKFVGRSVTHEALLEARSATGVNAPCHAQLLATHQSVAIIRGRPYWSGGHFMFIVLREPIARVWSFYNYVRRKSADFQTLPLLSSYSDGALHTPNATAAAGGSSPHWHWQLSNHMTTQLGTSPLSSNGTSATNGGKYRGGSLAAYVARQRLSRPIRSRRPL